MQNFIKTIINAVQSWTKKEIKTNIKNSTADWNQNDASAVDYVKNRTHWDESQHIVLVPETKISFDSDMVQNPFSINIIEGQTYKVTWDGVIYSCIAYIANGPDIPSIGNGYIGELSGGNNEPFFCTTFEGNVLLFAASVGTHTISISEFQSNIHKLDSKYLDLPTNLATTDDVHEAMDVAQSTANNKMDKSNPVGTGSFSMNRKSGTTVGIYSHAEGYNTTASGNYSHAEGSNTTASGNYSHAEGEATNASGFYSHAEGSGTTASGNYSHAEGSGTIIYSQSGFVNGEYNTSYDIPSDILRAGGYSRLFLQTGQFYCSDKYIFNPETSTYTLVSPIQVSANTIYSNLTSIRNKYFINNGSKYITPDVTSGNELCLIRNDSYTDYHNKTYYKIYAIGLRNPSNYSSDRYYYAHIVGNGTSDPDRSNAYTLDWNGVGWFQGGLQVGGNAQDDGARNVLLEGDAIPVPSTAQVGQTIVVSEVDENGKPTKWEAADISQGNDGIFTKLTSITLEEEVSEVIFDETIAPGITNCKELLVHLRFNGCESAVTSGWIRLYMGNATVAMTSGLNNSWHTAVWAKVQSGLWASSNMTSGNNVAGQVINAPALDCLSPKVDNNGLVATQYEDYETLVIRGSNLTLPIGTIIDVWGVI